MTRRPRFVAIASGLGWHVQDLLRAASGLGIDLAVERFGALSGRLGGASAGVRAGSFSLDLADAVIVRMMPPGSLEQVVFRMDALHRLFDAGVPVLNPPRAVEASVDKYLALARLEAAGLPVPPTWAGESAEGAMEAFEALGGDVIVKPIFGAEGRGLVRVSDRELARRVFMTLRRLGAVLYVQRAIPHPGFDYRAFVIDGRVLGAIRRYSPPGEWRTNVSVGGRAEAVVLDDALVSLAIRASAAVGARVAGVDILPDLDGRPFVLEVNAVPGWKALAGATGVDVASAILSAARGAR